MKKRKFSLLLNIATICLCVCAIAIGVYSAKTASLSINGSIGFEAHNCKVKVSGKLEGAYVKKTSGSNVLTSETKYFNSTGTKDGTAVAVYEGGDNNTWAIEDVYFNDLDCSNDQIATPMVLTFTLENISVYSVVASLVVPATIKNEVDIVGPTFKTSDSSFTYTDGDYGFVLPKSTDGESGETIEFSISLTPKEHKDINALSLNEMQITFDEAVEVNVTATSTANIYEYDQLSFTVDTTTKKAKVDPIAKTTVSVDIVIPSVIIYGENEYEVSKMNGINWYNNGFTNLKSLVIPNNIDYLPYLATSTLLETIIIPNNLDKIGNNFLYGCTSLTSITIPKSVTKIGGGIQNCSGLTSIIIPKGVIEIGPSAFSGCTLLEDVQIPSSVTNLKEDPASANFTGTLFAKKLREKSNGIYTCYDDSTKKILIFAPTDISSIDLTGVIALNFSAFSGCTNLTSVTIPDGIKILPGALFRNCTGLTSVTIPSSVIEMKHIVFNGCTNLKDIHFKGTKAQWNAITITSDWDTSTGAYTIHCTDGDIAKAS